MHYYVIPGIMPKYRSESSPKPTTERVLSVVCEFFSIQREVITNKDRSRKNVYPRQMAMYIMRLLCNEYYIVIARMFNRDHTTVIHSQHAISDLLDTDTNARHDLEQLKVLLYAETIQ